MRFKAVIARLRVIIQVALLVVTLLTGAITIFQPGVVESYAASYLDAIVLLDVSNRVTQPPGLQEKSERLTFNILKHRGTLQEMYRAGIEQNIRDELSRIKVPDCECRGQWAQYRDVSLQDLTRRYHEKDASLNDLVNAVYVQTADKLLFAARLFCLAIVVVLLLMRTSTGHVHGMIASVTLWLLFLVYIAGISIAFIDSGMFFRIISWDYLPYVVSGCLFPSMLSAMVGLGRGRQGAHK